MDSNIMKITIKHQINVSAVAIAMASILLSCASPAITPIASPATPYSSIQPGETIGEMVLASAENETGESYFYNYCSPIVAESDPKVMVRTCSVPQMSHLFIGYGDLASSIEEMDSTWSAERWQLYFDGHAVDLLAFGFYDTEWEGYKLRQWKVAINNLMPGEHKVRYVISQLDSPSEPYDITWIFTVGDVAASTTLSVTTQTTTYPTLSSTIAHGQHPYTSEKAKFNFLLYLPSQYGKDTQQRWPLILYLHGSGERGNNLDYLKIGGLPKKLKSDEKFPFVVVSPQIESQDGYWSASETTDNLFTLLEEIKAVHSIDSDRIYLTGVSLGGGGTWEIGLRYPDRFAALIPVMGYYGYPFGTPDNICGLKDVPIWAFHGAKDETVPLSAEQGLVNAMKACGGNVQFTVYPEGGHNIADATYADPDLYTWMLSQKLK